MSNPIIELVKKIIITLNAHKGPVISLNKIPPTNVGIMLTVKTPPEFTIYEVKVNSLNIYAGSLKINYPTILDCQSNYAPLNCT
jgi:hypothetical protein